MSEEYLVMDDAASLVKWNKEMGVSPLLREKHADLLIKELSKHDSELMIDQRGTLYFKEADRDLIEITLDDVIDQACEWNYRDIRDVKALCMNADGFEDFCKYDDKLSELKKTEKILNKLFDQTAYGRQITERMKELVEKTWGKSALIPVYDFPMYEDKPANRDGGIKPAPVVSTPGFNYEPSKGR